MLEVVMRVVKDHDGVARRVRLLDDDGRPVVIVSRFLDHLADRGMSPNTIRAYAYDLKHLFTFLAREGKSWREFRPATALELLGYLRRLPSGHPAQRLGLSVVVGGSPAAPQRLLAPASVQRILAGVSSFYDWTIAAEEYEHAESPMLRRDDLALARVSDRHGPFAGRASRQRPIRRAVSVRRPLRLPRPLTDQEVDALLGSLRRVRDLAIFVLMLDGGLRPGEVLGLHLEDVSYGRRRVTIRKRDDHPGGVRAKSRAERVVDVHEPRTLDAVSRYVLHERPAEATSPFVFLVGGNHPRRCEPLGYDAVVRLFARHMQTLGLRGPDKTPHALRHTHATAMWDGGMKELTLQRRLGHASPESTRIYTRVSDEAVVREYVHALESRS
jgi:integrase/recombinase XerD